jgi:acyl dehydratase
VSTVIGTRLPGTGAIYRAQSFRFHKPVRVGDTLTAQVEVREVDAARGELVLSTWISNQRGETVIDGEATVALLRALRDPA